MKTFSLGVLITSSRGDDGIDPGSLSALASRITTLGADALFVATSSTDGVEPVTALAAIAASNDLVLGAVVSLESGRHPAIVAKSATTLALLAPGRVALLFETERADGSPRLAEAVEVAASLRHDGPVRAGRAEFFVLDAYNEPRPEAADALGVGAIVDSLTPMVEAASDLVLVRVVQDDIWIAQDSKAVPLVRESMPVPSGAATVVVQVDGNSIDHVTDVIAQVIAAPR